MTLLEVDLGQCHTYITSANGTQSSKILGLISGNELLSRFNSTIVLERIPTLSFFNIKKTGNTNDYVLLLTFEKL